MFHRLKGCPSLPVAPSCSVFDPDIVRDAGRLAIENGLRSIEKILSRAEGNKVTQRRYGEGREGLQKENGRMKTKGRNDAWLGGLSDVP